MIKRVFTLIGRPELATGRFQTLEGRLEHNSEIDEIMQNWIGQRDLDEVVRRFNEAGAVAAPVGTVKDLIDNEHVKAREMITTVVTESGPLKMQGVFPKLSRTPGRLRWAGRRVGADTEAWLTSLGLSPEEIAELHRTSAI